MPDTFLHQRQLDFPDAESMTAGQKHRIADPRNPSNPFCELIGQAAPVAKPRRLACRAIGSPDHFAGDVSEALPGSPGVGETKLARMFVGCEFGSMSKSAWTINARMEYVMPVRGVTETRSTGGQTP